jgi:predicted aconitase with swiveling domain
VDITTASGCAISNIPLVHINKSNFEKLNNYSIEKGKNNTKIIVDAENEFIFFQ